MGVVQYVVAGGTGFLGSHLVARLRAEGDHVTVLTRRPRGPGHVQWDPAGASGSWAHVLDDADAVINLVGEPIAPKRWTPARKAALRDSRIRPTRTLVEAMTRAKRTPATLVSASAVGVYGPHGDEPVTEATPPGSGFLATLGKAWEEEALKASAVARVVLLRTAGLVLDKGGGGLPMVALPFYFMAGGPMGSGRQQMSWIHREDWTEMVRWALAIPAVTGPLNVTAPNPVTNREFARTLGRVLGRPAIMPAPAFALRIALGELADVLLTGQRVLPAKAESLGFRFRYLELEPALRAIYERP
jgi:uncharacterized protein (TIGR01777 family)